MNTQRGFTIVEVVVAIIMITIGAIGIARASGGMIEMLSRGDRATTAATLAQDQMERLRATPCTSMTYGTRTEQGRYILDWSVTAAPTVRRVLLTASYPNESGTRVDTFQTTVPCI